MNASTAVDSLREADAALGAANPSPFHLPVGELAPVVAGAIGGLSAADWWLPGLRERVGAVLRGVAVERLVDGFGGVRPYKVVAPTTSPANRALVAVGLAMSDPERAVLVHLGVGSASDGACYEAFNLASLQQAHVIFVLALRSLEGAPVPRQVAGDPGAVAEALGLAVHRVDGTNPDAVRAAVVAARSHDGPSLVVANL